MNAEATGLYASFLETLRLLRETSDPQIKKMWAADIPDIQKKAQELLDTGALNSHRISKMKIILSRGADQWLVLSKNSNSPLIPTF